MGISPEKGNKGNLMCGFVGFYGEGNFEDLRVMTETIAHRGPDSFGIERPSVNLYFGHRRLSIIDTSSTGNQPMWSHDMRKCLIYNGEIFNFKEIRDSLNRNWNGCSDTEVILEAISEWGVEKALSRMIGMFALVLYDSERNSLFLVRDRFGEKPLYYGTSNGIFFFGSELKSFRKHPLFRAEIDRDSLKSYFKYSYIPAPSSIYAGIKKLEPGFFIEYNLDSKIYIKKQYWSFQSKTSGTSTLTFNESSCHLENLLKTTIQNQMISDVPIGAFLSGGVDSSTVVAIMQSLSTYPVKTFSVGFQEKNYNEAHFAKEVANHLKTDHHEIYVSSYDALNVVPKLSSIYDEPFADPSQIPTYLISEMTKRKVSVALSGDGGDEIFGGYNRYIYGPKIVKSLFWLPARFRNLFAGLLHSIPTQSLNNMKGVSADKIYKFANALSAKDADRLYLELLSHWGELSSPVIGNGTSRTYILKGLGNEFVDRMMTNDALTYLPDDILVKVDRASMAVSLETRIPFLDHQIAEFVRSLPIEYKFSGNKGKVILRDVLYRYVPRDLIDRPKMGFSVPIEYWLRNDLKEWASNLMNEKRIREQGLLDYQMLKSKWDEHQSGKRNWQFHLWDVLMFQDWYENSFIR